MAIHKNRLFPDTCQCVLEFTFDDSLPDDQISQTVDNVIKCPQHSHLSTNEEVWNAIHDEMPRKNFGFDEILKRAPAAFWDLDTDGVTRKFKPGINVSFSFSGVAPNRIITITVTGVTLTTGQKNTVQTFLDNRFGAGKVVFVNG